MSLHRSAAADTLPPLTPGSSLPAAPGLYQSSASPSSDRVSFGGGGGGGSNNTLSSLASSSSSSNLTSSRGMSAAAPVLLARQQSVLHARGSAVAVSSLPAEEQKVVEDFRARVAEAPHVAIAVCAIQALTSVVRGSSSTTMMGLEKELQRAVAALKACNPASISLAAGCELFSRYVTRASLDIPRFDECVARVLERGEQFSLQSSNSRAQISELVDRFIADGKVLLIHGFSRVVHAVLLHAAARGKNFSVVVTEGRPNCDGYHAAAELLKAGIPCTLILDSAAAYSMAAVDLVLIGAEGVAESGGVINKIGTFQMCLTATAMKKPVYVAAESYKFARLFPLGQKDLPETKEQQPPFRPALAPAIASASASAAAAAAPHQAQANGGGSSAAAAAASMSGVAPASVLAAAELLFSPCSSSSSSSSSSSQQHKGSSSSGSSSAFGDKFTTLNPSCDYTPPEFLTLLFTDIGILTPSAVSDELIKLYY